MPPGPRRGGAGTAQPGHGRRVRGPREEAIEHFERALEIRTELGDRAGMAEVWTSIGVAQDALCRFTEAIASQERATEHTAHSCALVVAETHGDDFEQARALHRLGSLALAKGDRTGARTCWVRSARLYEPLEVADSALVQADLAALDTDSPTARA